MDLIIQIVVAVSGILSLIFLILYKMKEKQGYCITSLIFSLIVLGTLFYKLTYTYIASSTGAFRYTRYEKEHMELGGKYLGLYLSRIKTDTKSNEILVIDFPENAKLLASGADFSDSVIKGLRAGLAEGNSKYHVKSVVKANARDNSATWFTAAEFDRIMLENKDSGIVVSLVGYPSDFENISFGEKMDQTPKFVFFGGRLNTLEPAIKAQMVLAAITLVPGVSIGKRKRPDFKNIEEDFFESFLLVEPESLSFAKDAYPTLFK